MKKALKKEAKRERKEGKARRRALKKQEREQRKAEKRLRKQQKKEQGRSEPAAIAGADCGVPLDLMNTQARAPETREQYEARQAVVRRVVDPETGRTRLVKGDGEILEECVSRDRHLEINRQATAGDGAEFQRKTIGWKFD